MDTNVETALAKIQIYFDQAKLRLDDLKVGDKIAATVLAEEIAKSHGLNGPQVYPILKIYFAARESAADPDIKITRGALGGITKLR